MVFDEVDNGIGGAVAEIVGRELRQLGGNAQVLCVTHLPQVAAQGHQHLRVAKLSDGRSTRTSVTLLTPEERVDELARMLGGVEITPRARAHAHEMLAAVAAAAASAAAAAPANAKSSRKPVRSR
jgi:DNA repair protein RecN (Recombination protein N)